MLYNRTFQLWYIFKSMTVYYSRVIYPFASQHTAKEKKTVFFLFEWIRMLRNFKRSETTFIAIGLNYRSSEWLWKKCIEQTNLFSYLQWHLFYSMVHWWWIIKSGLIVNCDDLIIFPERKYISQLNLPSATKKKYHSNEFRCINTNCVN